MTLHTDEAQLYITVLAPDLVRVQMAPDGATPAAQSFAVSASPEQWSPCTVSVTETATATNDGMAASANDGTSAATIGGLTLQATFAGAAGPSGLTVEIERDPVRLTIRGADGRVAAACAPGGGFAFSTAATGRFAGRSGVARSGSGRSAAGRSGADAAAPDVAIDGTIRSAEHRDNGVDTGPPAPVACSWALHAPADARYYGFGQKQGYLDKRGQRMSLWATDEPLHILDNDELYQAIPFYLTMRESGQSTGVFVDCPTRVTYDVAKSRHDVCAIELAAPVLDAYVFTGPDPKHVVERYTELTGRMQLPPLWALGYQQCRYSYYPESRVREVAAEMRAREIPCDVIYLDIHYMDGYRVFTWDEERFPNPKQMVADLAADGFKTITIVDPGVKVDARYEVFQQGIRDDHFVCHPDGELFIGTVWPGRTAFPDFLREETRRWWGEWHRDLLQGVGIAAIWNDMNEPSCFARNTFPDEVLQGEDGEQVRHADVHNVYGQLMAVATYDALKRLQPEKRPFLLTRSGYAGIQRYAAVWMGDNHSWWEHLLMSMPMCLGMGLSGVPFVGTDIGGFQRDSNGELFARWMQMGAFMPFCRNHSALDTIDQEPWSFGPEVEAIARDFLRLRYRLLPFLYNEFYHSTQTGLPVMRPLLLEYAADPNTFNLSDQFLLGADLLVCPVYQPGATKRMVYLPAGDWVDFWTGARFTGARHIVADAPLETMPLFVRAGAIIPMERHVNHTGERDGKELFIHAYAGNDGQLELYEDAGEGFGYLQGESAVTTMTLNHEQDKITLVVDNPRGQFQPPREATTVHLYVDEDLTEGLVEALASGRIRVNGTSVIWGGVHGAPGTATAVGGASAVPSAEPLALASVGPLGELVVTAPTPEAVGFTLTVEL